MADDRDLELRRAAMEQVRAWSRLYDDIIPATRLQEGFRFHGQRVSYGAPFYSGIFRPAAMVGPAALTIATTAPKPNRDQPYRDGWDDETQTYVYSYRKPRKDTHAARLQAANDNRTLRAAGELGVPLIYFAGIAPGQYTAVAPVFVVRDDEARERVHLEAALPVQDVGEAGLVSEPDLRRYATREVRVRLHQHRFRALVLQAYTGRCAVCSLKESALLQAAHIIEDRAVEGSATVENGIALCAIHHLAYDRNLLGIDPNGVVHIASRLLHEIDGPMLSSGIQGFHGERLLLPRRRIDRPDPERLELRYDEFRRASA